MTIKKVKKEIVDWSLRAGIMASFVLLFYPIGAIFLKAAYSESTDFSFMVVIAVGFLVSAALHISYWSIFEPLLKTSGKTSND